AEQCDRRRRRQELRSDRRGNPGRSSEVGFGAVPMHGGGWLRRRRLRCGRKQQQHDLYQHAGEPDREWRKRVGSGRLRPHRGVDTVHQPQSRGQRLQLGHLVPGLRLRLRDRELRQHHRERPLAAGLQLSRTTTGRGSPGAPLPIHRRAHARNPVFQTFSMRGSLTMSTSKQLAGLLLLSTALTLPGVALAQTSTPTEEATSDAAAEPGEAPDISVPGGEIIVTGRINRDPTRNPGQVISVLSSEEIARTGEGDIAGALGRVTGLSVVGNALVNGRGLGDRYSRAYVDGLPR